MFSLSIGRGGWEYIQLGTLSWDSYHQNIYRRPELPHAKSRIRRLRRRSFFCSGESLPTVSRSLRLSTALTWSTRISEGRERPFIFSSRWTRRMLVSDELRGGKRHASMIGRIDAHYELAGVWFFGTNTRFPAVSHPGRVVLKLFPRYSLIASNAAPWAYLTFSIGRYRISTCMLGRRFLANSA